MTTPVRTKLPATRYGITITKKIGSVEIHVTINKGPDGHIREMFCKANNGEQGNADGQCIPISIGLQFGVPPDVYVRHLRFRKYPPTGTPGQPCSISDALGLALAEAMKL